jgi:hypothetical protein
MWLLRIDQSAWMFIIRGGNSLQKVVVVVRVIIFQILVEE